MKIPSSLLKLSLFACAQEVVQDALLRGCLPLAQAYLLQRKTGPHRNTEQVFGTHRSFCMGAVRVHTALYEPCTCILLLQRCMGTATIMLEV